MPSRTSNTQRTVPAPTLTAVLTKLSSCMTTELRGAALGNSFAPRTTRDWSAIKADTDVADFCTPAELPATTKTLVYATHGVASTHCSEFMPHDLSTAQPPVKVTVAIGQVPYTVCAASLMRLLTVLLVETGIIRDSAVIDNAVIAIRAHQQTKRDGTTSRRCGLYFVDFRSDAGDVIESLLRLHQRVLLADDRAFVSESASELKDWVAARDSFLVYQLSRRPELRQGAHSRFSKGLGPMTIERGAQPRAPNSQAAAPVAASSASSPLRHTQGRRSPKSPPGSFASSASSQRHATTPPSPSATTDTCPDVSGLMFRAAPFRPNDCAPMPTPSVSPDDLPQQLIAGQHQQQLESAQLAPSASGYAAPSYAWSLPPPFAHVMAPPLQASPPAPTAPTVNLFGVAGNVW